jgi:hypothetical protein
MQPHLSDIYSDWLILVHTILVNLNFLAPRVLEMVFLSLPGMNIEKWNKLNQQMWNIKQQTNMNKNNTSTNTNTQQTANLEREQKSVLRNFFDDLYDEQTQTTFPKIEELASKITSFKQPKQQRWSWHSETESLGLDQILK